MKKAIAFCLVGILLVGFPIESAFLQAADLSDIKDPNADLIILGTNWFPPQLEITIQNLNIKTAHSTVVTVVWEGVRNRTTTVQVGDLEPGEIRNVEVPFPRTNNFGNFLRVTGYEDIRPRAMWK